MRVECLHGYYKFSETAAGQIARFASLFGLVLERAGDHFTFSDLVEAPRYSIAGGTYLGCPVTETLEGDPWDVMRANGIVYDFSSGLVVPIESITTLAELAQAGFTYVSNGMILGGSVTDDGSRVTDYAAFYLQDRANFKYSEVEFG